ncbi:ACP S-malonyltransferase [Occultella glacieicola]|uniref:[acyl-carrier-protein] S-malonyltransferase n=1 Tax=Occultella glacieicola TaxID=2518684 RepID=A0ABY2DZJ2_9MICO|nr:ACP S-malonyltransferase [Occultella glacieicola]TDE90005.1 ACP S-malonyltransferase [Occultella glacieicola]
MIAVLSPGQGAQSPGMLAPWLELDGTTGSLSDELDGYADAVGLDLRALGTTADADTIKDTAVAQPLIVATSLLALSALQARVGDVNGWAIATAGHSVGEFAAVAAAGVLPATDALRLVAVRGSAMAHAAAAEPTGMSAVVGGDAGDVLDTLSAYDLVAANVNGGGQIVAAGALPALAALAAEPPAKARVIPLAVAGAFHTRYMASAVDAVAAAAAALTPADPRLTLLSNADGAAVASGADALAALVRQISAPVRWDLCQQTLVERGVQAAIELAPGGVLTGLARRTMRGVETIALKSPADLDAAADLIARHHG